MQSEYSTTQVCESQSLQGIAVSVTGRVVIDSQDRVMLLEPDGKSIPRSYISIRREQGNGAAMHDHLTAHLPIRLGGKYPYSENATITGIVQSDSEGAY